MEPIEIAKLKEKILKNAILYSNCINEDNNYKIINRLMKKLQSFYELAKEHGAQDLYQDLVFHEDDNIKYLGATFLIKSNPELARNTLIKLIESKKIVGLNAKTTLDMWEKGMLDLL